MVKILDLSVHLDGCISEPFPPKIEYMDHYIGAKRMAKLAGIKPEDFPDSMALATENVMSTTHSGTHIDAPYHYGPLSEGEKAKSIDEIPLEWCFGDGVVLDMKHKAPGSEITVEDLEEALTKINYTLKPFDIVMLNTGADRYWGTDQYMEMQCGLGYKGTKWLLDQGIKCIGIDAWTLDRPAKAMGETYKQTGNRDELWASHMYGRKKEYIQIEKLTNLDKLPKPYGFKVAAFPIKLRACSAGWTRAVALWDE